jgi:hypothetical protein
MTMRDDHTDDAAAISTHEAGTPSSPSGSASKSHALRFDRRRGKITCWLSLVRA